MQQFYKKFLEQTFFFTIQTKIVFSEIKDLSKVGLILLHACVYKYIIVHWQTEKFCHRESNLETSTLENIQTSRKNQYMIESIKSCKLVSCKYKIYSVLFRLKIFCTNLNFPKWLNKK